MKCTIEYKILGFTLEQLDYACYSWQEFEQKYYRHPSKRPYSDNEFGVNAVYKVTICCDDGSVWTNTKFCTVDKFYKSVKRTVERLIVQATIPFLD